MNAFSQIRRAGSCVDIPSAFGSPSCVLFCDAHLLFIFCVYLDKTILKNKFIHTRRV